MEHLFRFVGYSSDRKFQPSTYRLRMCGLTRRKPVNLNPSLIVGCVVVMSFGA